MDDYYDTRDFLRQVGLLELLVRISRNSLGLLGILSECTRGYFSSYYSDDFLQETIDDCWFVGL